ncbi:hypothetical protein C8R46DRAFT_1109315 [Mycena filopes]|nr:hypothetical protein C8R46DRAFT_1109315 [Mycena filopes]
MSSNRVTRDLNTELAAFASGLKYRPSFAFPPLDDASWDCADTSPAGAAARKALRASHETSGKAALEHGIVQIIIQSEGLVGKPVGYSTTLQRAVTADNVLKAIFTKANPKLVAGPGSINVVTGLYQYIGAYIAQVKGDVRLLIQWLRPILQPVLEIADVVYMESKLYKRNRLIRARRLESAARTGSSSTFGKYRRRPRRRL